MAYPDVNLKLVDPKQLNVQLPAAANLQLNAAQKIFGDIVIDGTNSIPEIQIKSDTPNVVNFKIIFDVENASIPTGEYELLITDQPELVLTPTFETNDGVLRLWLSFKVHQSV